MARNQNAKQINFIPAEDIAEELEKCENKTKVINEALRLYFSTGPLRLDLIERIQDLEDFRRRFMAYYARTDGQPHTEFCDCETCRTTRQAYAPARAVPLDPEPQTFEKVLSVIERAIDQATRMNATVLFETRVCEEAYKFRITSSSNAIEEYSRYREFADVRTGVAVTIPNPMV